MPEWTDRHEHPTPRSAAHTNPAASIRTAGRGCMLLGDAESELKHARPSHRSTAEECSLQQVFLVEDVVDVELGTDERATEGERESGAAVHDEAWFHLDPLVEIKESGPVRAIAVGWIDAVGKARSVGAGETGVGLLQ